VGPAGHRTFGKGSVQTLYDLPSMPGASLKMTTAKYYTPLGRSIEDEKGLQPDVFAPITDDQRRAIIQAGKIGYLLPEQVGKSKSNNKSGLETINDITGMDSGMEEGTPALPASPEISDSTSTPVTVDEVFKDPEKEPAEKLYDIELFTAYQCLKGAEVLAAGGKMQYSRANTGN